MRTLRAHSCICKAALKDIFTEWHNGFRVDKLSLCVITNVITDLILEQKPGHSSDF